jgi:AraC-like DNA-binding protein
MKNADTNATPAIPLVKAAFVVPFRIAMEKNGIDADRYFRKFRLPQSDAFDPEALVPEKPFWRLVNQVAIAELIPDFGMQVAHAVPWYQIDSLKEYLQRRHSLKALLDTFCDLASGQSNTSSFGIRIDGTTCWFENAGEVLVNHDIQMELYRVTSMIELVQLATGRNWKPAVVNLMMDRNQVAGKNRILDGCVLMFSQPKTAIAFPAGLLDASISVYSQKRPSPATRTIEIQPLDNIQDKNELASALREIIALYVTEDDLSIEVIADIAGLSTRSLQRMMKKHGLSYNDLLNEARQHYALEKLNTPSTKISDIAFQLGYKDAAHFTRAFKRWTGVSPSVYRKNAADK